MGGYCPTTEEFDASNISQRFVNHNIIINGSMVSAQSLNSSELAAFCSDPVVQQFAKLATRYVICQQNGSIPSSDGSTNGLAMQVFFTALFIMVGCIGLAGNILTVIVIAKTAALHSHTNYFLASLAISDLFLIVFGVTFDLQHLWDSEAPAIPGYCSLMSTTISMFTLISILTIMFLTAERFAAICYPFAHRALFDKRRVENLIYGIWIFAFVPSLYTGMQFTRVSRDFICGFNYDLGLPHGHCDYVTSPDAPFRFPFEITAVMTFLVPLMFIVVCYIRILATLNEMAATTVHCPIGMTNSDNSQITSASILYVHTRNEMPPRSQQAQKMVIKMLVIVTTVFFVCYLPNHIQRLIVQYSKADCDNSDICQLLYPISGVLQYVSAMLNPILYNLMSVRFRTGFNHLIKEFFSSADREYSAIREQNCVKPNGAGKA